MKTFVLLLSLLPCFGILANKIIEEISVNFFTLAAHPKELDNKKVGITGWIRFLDYKENNQVRLFHSKSSLNEFRVEESILVKIPTEGYLDAKEYLNLKLVTVYAKYSAPKSIGVYGYLSEIRDVNITSFSSGI